MVGGGGGGRDTVAQAGGRDPSRLEEALRVARDAIRRGLGERLIAMRVLAIDHGSARAGLRDLGSHRHHRAAAAA